VTWIHRLTRRVLVPLATVALSACGGDDCACGEPPEDAGSAGATGSPDAAFAGSGGDAGRDACSASALADPIATTVYYVAIEEPSADNDSCDGLAPVDEGGGHCPFADFSSPRVRSLLDGGRDVRVEVRSGTYVITEWEGLRITGVGASEAERIVLSAYPGEQPVFDVPRPDGIGCTEASAMVDPNCVRQVLRISGTYTVVQGLTIQNGLGYHAEITGGAHHLFRCNALGETVAFTSRSDCLKLDGGASDVEVLHNEFTRFRSQAIDMTGVSDVLVEGNEFHHPIDEDAGATGCKYGIRNVVIRDNDVHDLGSSPTTHAFSLGGVSGDHADDREASGIRVADNRVWNVAGIAAQFVSCTDCAFEDNDVWNTGAGLVLSSSGTGLPSCTTSTSGCQPTARARVFGNRFREMHGGGDPASANSFILIDAGEQAGFEGGDNLYCSSASVGGRFGWEGAWLGFEEWVSASGTDASSTQLSETAAECSTW
jgi:hypothetical protein